MSKRPGAREHLQTWSGKNDFHLLWISDPVRPCFLAITSSNSGADTGRGGRGRPPLPASWHKAPLSARRVLFLLVSEVLSLLSLLRGALLRTWRATLPFPVASRHPHPHQGALLHTRALSSTSGHPPPHQGTLLHTRAPSSTLGRSPPHQGAVLHLRALFSTPGRSPPHQGALHNTRALSSTPGRSPPHQGAPLHTRPLYSTLRSPHAHQGAFLHNRALSSTPGRPPRH